MIHRSNVAPMLGQRRRRWANIGLTFDRIDPCGTPVLMFSKFDIVLQNYTCSISILEAQRQHTNLYMF